MTTEIIMAIVLVLMLITEWERWKAVREMRRTNADLEALITRAKERFPEDKRP